MSRRPTVRAAIFDLADPGANTGIIAAALGAGITPGADGAYFDVFVALEVGSDLVVTCTDGTDTHKWDLNEDLALGAADLFRFKIMAPKTDHAGSALTYDFEAKTTGGKIEALFVYELHEVA